MAESKYEKYVTRNAEMLLGHDPDGTVRFGVPENLDYKITDKSITTTGPRMGFSNNHVKEASCKIEYGYVLKDMVLMSTKENNYGAHTHEYAEIFLFFGNDPYDTSYLGGEGEFWMGEGDEMEIIKFDKSCSIYIPGNVGHFPCFFRNVKSPINFIVVVPSIAGNMKINWIKR